MLYLSIWCCCGKLQKEKYLFTLLKLQIVFKVNIYFESSLMHAHKKCISGGGAKEMQHIRELMCSLLWLRHQGKGKNAYIRWANHFATPQNCLWITPNLQFEIYHVLLLSPYRLVTAGIRVTKVKEQRTCSQGLLNQRPAGFSDPRESSANLLACADLVATRSAWGYVHA